MEPRTIEYQGEAVRRRGRSNNSCQQAVDYIARRVGQKLAFCDASPSFAKDGYTPTSGKLAVWALDSMQFSVKEVNFFGLSSEEISAIGKQEATHLLEIEAIVYALTLHPDHLILSDNRFAVITCKRLYPTHGIDWIPRELNAIANKLAKQSRIGTGYIALNATSPQRNWVDFVFEAGDTDAGG